MTVGNDVDACCLLLGDDLGGEVLHRFGYVVAGGLAPVEGMQRLSEYEGLAFVRRLGIRPHDCRLDRGTSDKERAFRMQKAGLGDRL
jgi:hypothetical protein